MHFKALKNDDDIQKVIKAAFDTEVTISGGWGYTAKDASIIQKQDNLKSFEHTLASMRCYLEMNMTLDEKSRYGSINLNETAREFLEKNTHFYDKVTYKVTAMKEVEYAAFIDEYKENYGKSTFDMQKHFQRRKEATLNLEIIYYFNLI